MLRPPRAGPRDGLRCARGISFSRWFWGMEGGRAMIVELGHYALILALALALVQMVLPLAGAARGNLGWMDVGRQAAVAQFLMVGLAMAALMHAYITSDFSVINVVENSHTDKPMLYKVTGVWGNHEGSMLLWVFILSLCGAAVAVFSNNLPPALRARVLSVQAMISVGFLLFILFTSNPFLRTDPPPANGHGLNPVLQDPGLAFHPPFLYLGYVGFSVSFAFAVAALIEGRVDPAWARWVRPWALASWCALTIGIAMGSWWAYYTLGWGGWWFWDPVENASLMPWIVGTALIHSSVVVEKRDALKSWTILLAIITFSLSLVGTFLVRSGVLTSVHAFAVDPERGLFILGLLVVAIGGSLTLYAVRAPVLKGGGLFAPISREGSLVLNNILLTCCAATVFLGTLYPLFLDAVGGAKVSVGPPYYDRTFGPLIVPVLLAMVAGPMLAWKRGDLAGALQRLWAAFGFALLVCLGAFYATSGGPVLAVLGLGLAGWVAMGVLVEWADRVRLFRVRLRDSARRAVNLPRASYGMTLAHFGIAITAAGIAASAFAVERIDIVPIGGNLDIAGFQLHFDGVAKEQGANFTADNASITIREGDRVIGVVHPQRRFFPLQQQTTSETSIHTNLLADLYVALGDPDPGSGGWTLRVYWKPLVPWIWIGAVIMAFGGLVSLSDRRWRVGVAARLRAARRGVQTAPGD
jgi:cytochrome c-type biogenesis protein CcmF